MGNSLKILFEEHRVIESAVKLIHQIDKLIKDKVAYETTVRKLLQFFRVYGDRIHHHKEEEILFPEMKRKNELLGDGVIGEMFENHDDFRSTLKNVERFLDKKEYLKSYQELCIYGESILDHIAVENDEVFQMAETLFSIDEIEKINFRFEDYDRELGGENKSKMKEELNEIKNLIHHSLE